jgi:hypothetical protein
MERDVTCLLLREIERVRRRQQFGASIIGKSTEYEKRKNPECHYDSFNRNFKHPPIVKVLACGPDYCTRRGEHIRLQIFVYE